MGEELINEKLEIYFITGDNITYKPDYYSYNNVALELYYEHDRFFHIIPMKNIREITISKIDEDEKDEFINPDWRKENE